MWKKDLPYAAAGLRRASRRDPADRRRGSPGGRTAEHGPRSGRGRALSGPRRRHARSIMNAADALALSSVVEGLPMALLEAAASGLPAVATDCGGVREAVRDGETAFVVPPGDPAALAAAMSKLAALPPAGRECACPAPLAGTPRASILPRSPPSGNASIANCWSASRDGCHQPFRARFRAALRRRRTPAPRSSISDAARAPGARGPAPPASTCAARTSTTAARTTAPRPSPPGCSGTVIGEIAGGRLPFPGRFLRPGGEQPGDGARRGPRRDAAPRFAACCAPAAWR